MESSTTETPELSVVQRWSPVRFDVMADNIARRVDPAESDAEVYIGLEHLDKESLSIVRCGTPSDVSGQKLAFQKGDVIFGRRRAYQRKLGVADCDGICSAHAMVVRAKAEVVDPDYLAIFMQTNEFMERAIAISVGSLSPTINWRTMRTQEFLLPEPSRQKEIAEILKAASTAEENYRIAMDHGRRAQRILFRGLYEKWRSTQKTDGLATVDDAIIDIVAGKSPSASSVPAEEDEFGVLKVSAVGDYAYHESENKALMSDSDYVADAEVRPGFLLVTRANALVTGVGRACIVENTRPNLMLSDKTLRFIEDTEVVRRRFLLETLRSRICRRHIEATASGTEAKNISQKKLKAAPIWLPPTEIQDDVLKVINATDDALRNLRRHLQVVGEMKRGLRERLMVEDAFQVMDDEGGGA